MNKKQQNYNKEKLPGIFIANLRHHNYTCTQRFFFVYLTNQVGHIHGS